jgi:type III pantothenate kinase
MNIAVNIGNTNTAVSAATASVKVATASYRSVGEFTAVLKNHIKAASGGSAVICSVVPAKTAVVEEALSAFTGRKPVTIGLQSPLGLDLSLYDTRLVGMDRLVACYAAMHFYRLPAVIFDLGTASTVSVVNSSRQFLGGAIVPGMQTMLNALTGSTALLPAAAIGEEAPLIGRNTRECMITGAITATAGFIKNYKAGLTAVLGYETQFILTGGNAYRLSTALTGEGCVYDADLILKGLLRIGEN